MINFNQKKFLTYAKNIALIILIIIVISLRFFNLDLKPYWYDETYTSLRNAGYTTSELIAHFGVDEHNFGELSVHRCPNPEKDLEDKLHSLITDSSHPPLYLILLHVWTKFLGCKVYQIRLFSVLVSVLIVPGVYLLCRELLLPSKVIWIATGLVIISPVYLIYSQEARSYSLLLVLTIFSNYLLLRTLREEKKTLWIAYTAISTLGLYCHTLYYFILIGQLVYTHVILKSSKSSLHRRKRRNYLIASCISFFAFLAWIVRVISIQGLVIRIGADYSWNEIALSHLIKRILMNFSVIFYDFNFLYSNNLRTLGINENSELIREESSLINSLTNIYFPSIIMLLVISSIIWVVRESSPKFRNFILTMPFLSVVFLFKDFVFGGYASAVVRYQLPTYYCIYLAVAYFLYMQINIQRLLVLRLFWTTILVVIFGAGICSNLSYLRAQTWWSKYRDSSIKEVAEIINHKPEQVILTDANRSSMVELLTLSYVVDSKARFQIVEPEDLLKRDFLKTVFLYSPHRKMLDIVYENPSLRSRFSHVRGKLYQLASSKLPRRE